MLSPDNHLGIFAALIGLAALAFWLQNTRLVTANGYGAGDFDGDCRS
jgi:hypothetical protein